MQIPPLRSGRLLSCLGLTRKAERVEESEKWKGPVKAAVDPSTQRPWTPPHSCRAAAVSLGAMVMPMFDLRGPDGYRVRIANTIEIGRRMRWS